MLYVDSKLNFWKKVWRIIDRFRRNISKKNPSAIEIEDNICPGSQADH